MRQKSFKIKQQQKRRRLKEAAKKAIREGSVRKFLRDVGIPMPEEGTA